MKDPKEILKNFSLNEKEVDIYLANLALGKVTVAKIARKVGMNRTAAYFHIKNLEKRGILRSIKKEKVLHYFAVPPEDFYDKINETTKELKNIIPFLDSLKKTEDEAPIINVTEAKKGYLEIYDTISNLPENSTFRIIESSLGAKEELNYIPQEELDNFFRNIIKNNITTRAIFSEDVLLQPTEKLDKKSLEIFQKRNWEISTLSKEMLPIKNIVFLYQNKISILLPQKTIIVTIEHPGISETFTEIFETLFAFGKKQDTPWKNTKDSLPNQSSKYFA